MTKGCVDELASGLSDRGHRDRQAALLQIMDVVMRDQRLLLLCDDVDAKVSETSILRLRFFSQKLMICLIAMSHFP